jgi:hypothetical protein
MGLNFFRLLLVERRKVAVCLTGYTQKFVQLFACMAWVSRCSARWINSVITHVATVAALCQPNDCGSKINQSTTYTATTTNASGWDVETPTKVSQDRIQCITWNALSATQSQRRLIRS